MLHIFLLLACAIAIYVACEWFVNAVEWLGVRLNVGHIAVGTVLAAIGTALPESVVTLVAALFGSPEHGADIAVGAALGGPLVVGTIAYAMVGMVILFSTRNGALIGNSQGGSDHEDLGFEGIDSWRLARDQLWFLAIFSVKIALGLLAFAIKPWLGVLFLIAYAVYFYREMSGDETKASADGLEPLKLQPNNLNPAVWAISIQTVVTLAVIFGASQIFVKQLEWAGPALGLPSVVVALLLAPIATELPEILNAIIWTRQGKMSLALANISGSMMIQATVPSAIGLFLTPWRFDASLILAGIITMSSIAYLAWLLHSRKLTPLRLSASLGFYILFAVALLISLHSR